MEKSKYFLGEEFIYSGKEENKEINEAFNYIQEFSSKYPSANIAFGNSIIETSFGLTVIGTLFNIEGVKVYKSLRLSAFASGYDISDENTQIIISNVYHNMINCTPEYGPTAVALIKTAATHMTPCVDISRRLSNEAKASIQAARTPFNSKSVTTRGFDKISRVILLDTIFSDKNKYFCGSVNGINVAIKTLSDKIHFSANRIERFKDHVGKTLFESLYNKLDTPYTFTIAMPSLNGDFEKDPMVVEILDLIRKGMNDSNILPSSYKGLLVCKSTDNNF
ncbi:MAG: hypothetical protein ACRC92_18770 [Peptostreptococcaceae bacterium]